MSEEQKEIKLDKSVLVGITSEGKPQISVEGNMTALESLGLVYFLETTLKESAERMLGIGTGNQLEMINSLGKSVQTLQTNVQTSSYMMMQVLQTLQLFSEQLQALLSGEQAEPESKLIVDPTEAPPPGYRR